MYFAKGGVKSKGFSPNHFMILSMDISYIIWLLLEILIILIIIIQGRKGFWKTKKKSRNRFRKLMMNSQNLLTKCVNSSQWAILHSLDATVSTMYSFRWQTVPDGSVASARSGDFGIWEIVKIYALLPAAKTLISLPEKSLSVAWGIWYENYFKKAWWDKRHPQSVLDSVTKSYDTDQSKFADIIFEILDSPSFLLWHCGIWLVFFGKIKNIGK